LGQNKKKKGQLSVDLSENNGSKFSRKEGNKVNWKKA